MIKNPILFIIDNNGDYLRYGGTLRAINGYREFAFVISPRPLADGVSMSIMTNNANYNRFEQYALPTAIKVNELIEESDALYQTIADWNVFGVEIKPTALADISNFRSGATTFSFQFQTPHPSVKCVTYKGVFGVDNPLPTTGQVLGDYYECEDWNFYLTSGTQTYTFTKGMYVYFNGSRWIKDALLVELNTSTVSIPVEPSHAVGYEIDDDDANYLASIGAAAILAQQTAEQSAQDVEDLKDGTTPIFFDKTGTDLDAEFIEEAIKEVNVKTNANKQNIEKIVDGTQTVKKAEQDASGNVITTTYETKADATSKLATKVDKTRKIIGIDLQDDILLTEFKTAIGNATQSVAGLLSAEDKTHLDGLVALLESSDGNNIVDTIGEILEIFQNYPEGADLVTVLQGKVDKIEGKGLSTNDYTNEDKLKVNEIPQIQEDLNSLTIGEFGVGFVTNNMLSNEVKESINIKRPNVITLIGGQDDEVPKPALSLNTVTTDLVNFKIGDRGWKVNIDGNTGHLVDFEPESGAWSFPPICAIGAWIYIEDSTKLTNLRINFYNDSAKTIISSYPAEIYGFKTGWNLFRWSVDYPNTKLEFSSIYRIRLTGGTTDATSYTIGHIWAECSEKAQILFIHDGGYKDFYLNGYPDLKARNIPVTWGLIPNRIDTGDVAFLTPVQADILSKENNNSMSFHSWNLDVLNNFNASQLRAETMKSLKWLKSKGYTGGIFRSAFTQNLAPEHAAIQNLVLAYRRVSNGTTNTLTCYPFPNRYDIDMIRLHQFNSNLQGLTDMFASMKKFRTLMVGYTHMVNVAGATDMTPELWNHFLNLIDNGIAEGWLEGVTFETLIARSGVKFKRGLGDTVIEIYDEVGELKKIRLP